MSAPRGWTVWLVLAGVFLAGGVAGGFVSLRVAKSMVQKGRSAEQFVPNTMQRLNEGLSLSPEQEEKVREVVDRTWAVLRQHRRSSVEAMRAQEAEIMTLLTPEQQAAYAVMQEEHRSRWQRLMGRRGPGGRDGEGPPSGGPPPEPEGPLPQPPPRN